VHAFEKLPQGPVAFRDVEVLLEEHAIADFVDHRSQFVSSVLLGGGLGGQLKTGQLGSLQNRPTGVAQDVILLSRFLLIGQV